MKDYGCILMLFACAVGSILGTALGAWLILTVAEQFR